MNSNTNKQVAKSLADAPHTRLYDAIVKEVGDTSSKIFGVVFRHSLMRKGMCYATKETLAQVVGTSKSSVIRHINKLVETGYLIDHSPNEKFRPHGYTIGPKAIETLRDSVSQCNDSVSQCNDSVSQCYGGCVTVTPKESIKNQLRINKDSKTTTTTSLLEVITAYNDLKIRMTDYYFNTWLKDNADNALTWGSTIEEFATAVDVLMQKIVMRLKRGEVLGDDVLFDSDIFEESLYEVKMIGSEAILTELFQAEVIVR